VLRLIASTGFERLFAHHQEALFMQQLAYFVLKLVELYNTAYRIVIESIKYFINRF
jgi:hypothetical protein